MGRRDQARRHQVGVERRTFFVVRMTQTHIGAMAKRPEAARSGETFEERPGQADPRQGGAAGHAGARPDAGGTAQSRHRPGPRRRRLADWRSRRPRQGSGTIGPSAAAGQFLGPPRRLRQCAPGARLGGARLRRGAAAGLCRQSPGLARRTRSRSGARARHRGTGRRRRQDHRAAGRCADRAS